ncbi:MAG TPA: SOS response-associated peptidase family protein [Paracoccaceae bacterium]|nr:SOS response-associated peptidase family protein [Paracoccaceae bacterium]
MRPPLCNLFSNTMPVEAMRRLFAAAHDRLGNQPPLPSIFPRHEAPVVRRLENGGRELVRMHWGFLMPQVSKKTGQPILPKAVNNTRDDTVQSSPFWRESFEQRRCLVPATSFCEANGSSPATYYWFGLTGEEPRPPFAFAGIWRRFRGNYRDELVELDTCSILTTRPNELIRRIHPDRMPVILPAAAYGAWLEGPGREAAALLAPFPAEQMRIVRSGIGEKEDPLEADAA